MKLNISNMIDIAILRLVAHSIHEPVKSCEILYPDPFP